MGRDKTKSCLYISDVPIDCVGSSKRKNRKVLSSEVIFNGTNYPIVSDHFGVMVTEKE